MIEKYWRFDVDSFFKDFKRNEQLLKNLQVEKESIAEVESMDYSEPRVGGGITSDPTLDRVRRRMSIDDKIKTLNEYFTLEKKIYEGLDNIEKLIIDQYFKVQNRQSLHIRKICEQVGYSENWVYTKVRDIRKKIRNMAEWV